MRPRRALSVLLAACLVARSGLAIADDVVTLTDGTQVRGTVLEDAPPQPLVVRTTSGKKTVKRSTVRSVEYDGDAASAASAGPTATTPAPAGPTPSDAPATATKAAAPAPPTARVHVEAGAGVQLESQGPGIRPGTFVWVKECDAPCDTAVPVAGTYRLSGGIRPTNTFSFAGSAGQAVTVDVKARSQGTYDAGLVVGVVGAVATLTGIIMGIAGANGTTDSAGNSVAPDSGMATAGWVTAGIGGVVLLVAAIMVLPNGSSKATVRATPASAAAPQVPAAALLPARPEPVLPSSTAVSLPIVGLTF